MCDVVTVVLDEQDADRLLRMLYNGARPKKVHTLVCLCGTIADLRVSERAWNGWQVLPTAKCPACLGLKKEYAHETVADRNTLHPEKAGSDGPGGDRVDQGVRRMT